MAINSEFDHWLSILAEDCIHGEYGIDEHVFRVYSSHWRPLYDMRLTPWEAWQRGIAGYNYPGYARIVPEDVAAIAKSRDISR